VVANLDNVYIQALKSAFVPHVNFKEMQKITCITEVFDSAEVHVGRQTPATEERKKKNYDIKP